MTEGGEARNHEADIEAVARALLGPLTAVSRGDDPGAVAGRAAEAAIAALDAVRPRNHEAEVERLREALGRIADGEVDGVGDYSECVQLYARQVLDAVRRSPDEAEVEAAIVRALDELHNDMGLHTRTIVAAKRAALDAVRRSPQGEDPCRDCGHGLSRHQAQEGACLDCDCMGWSPQGEDHEAGIEAAYMRGYRAHAAGLTADPTEAARDLSPERHTEKDDLRSEFIKQAEDEISRLERHTEKLVKALKTIVRLDEDDEDPGSAYAEIAREALAEYSSLGRAAETETRGRDESDPIWMNRQTYGGYHPNHDPGRDD